MTAHTCTEYACPDCGLNTMSAAQHEAITSELVRLTLGGRGPSRPELRVDLLGVVYRAARTLADRIGTSWLAAARALAAAGIEPTRTP